MQLAVVANGDKKIEKEFARLSKIYENISYKTFSEELSNLGKAASDFILMPSRYEPCGLPQMEAPRFGTLPIVRATGGLKDTVKQLDFKAEKGNGFLFEYLDREGIEFAIKEALTFYAQPYEVKKSNIERVMTDAMDKFNLKNTAMEYIKVYRKLVKEKRDNK